MALVNLTRQFVVQVYCLARQAERSVDASLFTPWSDLATYYKEERTARLRDVLSGLQALLEGMEMPLFQGSREEMLRNVTGPGLIGYLSGPCVARWKKRWTFAPKELSFVAATFQAFLRLLQTSQQPTREALIALRMDFWTCEHIIKCRCHGMAEIRRATHIEHFNQSAHVVPVKMNELVSSPVEQSVGGSESKDLVVQREPHP
jgi:hypothetical protein